MSTHTVTSEQEVSEFAENFAQMAERIRHNAKSTFGGAFVIVSPDGDMMETLILDEKADPATFLMVLQAKIQTRLEQLKDAERRGGNPFGR